MFIVLLPCNYTIPSDYFSFHPSLENVAAWTCFECLHFWCST